MISRSVALPEYYDKMKKPLFSDGLLRIAVMVLAMAGAGCINTPLPDYYVLTPEAAAEPVSRGSRSDADRLARLAIGVGPITIPETINRPNIVTPRDSNQLNVAEYHRWSEPLRENISRVVITNIAGRLGLNKLYAYPWLGNQIDYQVRIDVLQMIGSVNSDVYLQIRWQVLTGEKRARLIDTRITEYRVPVAEENYSAMVAAYSVAVAAFSDDIASAVAALSAQASISGVNFKQRVGVLD